MRIIEAKNILDRVINEDRQVIIENQPGFNSAVFLIPKMEEYIEFLYFISGLSFSDLTREEIEQVDFIKSRRNMLSEDEFNILNSLINRSNGSLKIVYSVIDYFTEKQDPKLINIKIPESIKTLEELSSFNKKIEDLFKIFDYGNDKNNFTFSGMDKGTSWLEIIVNNISLHIDFTLSLNLALHFVHHWNSYKTTNNYKLNLNIFCNNNEDKNNEDYQEIYKKEFFETELKKEELKEQFELNGRTENEKITRIIKGAQSIIKILGEGSELRISYNPPEYIDRNNNFFEIDYKKLPKAELKKVEEKKKIALDQPKNKSDDSSK